MSIKVVKIGGNVIDNHEALAGFLADFARMPGRKILVHGGGREASRLSKQMGIETTMIDGRRVTSEETLRVVTMVYAGLVNKRLVSMLQQLGCNAIGLTGADGNSITARRRPAEPIDFGFVGDIMPQGVNSRMLAALLDAGMTPVFCAITHDGQGTLLNCNADSVASAVAIGASSIEATDLVYCFELPGVMEDISRPDSLIPLITPGIYSDLRARGVVNSGMIPKIDNAFASIEQGVRSVIIKSADRLNSTTGTTIRQ